LEKLQTPSESGQRLLRGATNALEVYEFGPFRLDPAGPVLLRGAEPVPLTPKAAEMLLALVRRAGHLVGKEELMKEVWPDTFVEEGNLSNNVWTLRKALEEDAAGCRYIDTVPKRGYRFVAEVRRIKVDAARPAYAAAQAAEEFGRRPVARPWTRARSGLWLGALGTLALVAGVAVVAFYWRTPGTPAAAPPRPASIAVLPFDDLGQGGEDDYLADGLTETLITELARVPGLQVIGRNSAFQYKGKAVDLRRVGAELGVRYVLEGSIQRSGTQLRVNAQLIDAATGQHVWAEKYDRPASGIFPLQDEIARGVREATAGGRVGASAKPLTDNPAAYDAYLRARFHFHRPFKRGGPKGYLDAIPLLERSVALDPGFARAHAALGNAYAMKFFFFNPDRHWEEQAHVEIEKALLLDPGLAEAFLARGNLLWTQPNRFPHEQAIREYRRALDADPNLAAARMALGKVYQHVGLLDKSLEELETALKTDPLNEETSFRIGQVHFYQHDYAKALSVWERRRDPHWMRAAALSHAGRNDEAAQELERFLREQPASPVGVLSLQAVMLARSGDHAGAERRIRRVAGAARNERGYSSYHHHQYNVGAAYALMGRSRPAVEWLERAAAEGFPCYPFYEKDPDLRPLKDAPEFQAFMARLKQQWERYRQTL
jgi:TolB-like protein/DNA-binding winged helix-turn-helix (wHTH) protein/Tfp pilus assembly protein PilF